VKCLNGKAGMKVFNS